MVRYLWQWNHSQCNNMAMITSMRTERFSSEGFFSAYCMSQPVMHSINLWSVFGPPFQPHMSLSMAWMGPLPVRDTKWTAYLFCSWHLSASEDAVHTQCIILFLKKRLKPKYLEIVCTHCNCLYGAPKISYITLCSCVQWGGGKDLGAAALTYLPWGMSLYY